jgi:hypothetical protein
MGPPAWLYYLFGVLMLAVAAYGVLLFGLSLASRRTAGRDVDISHTLMGIAMAGLFVPAWRIGGRGFWQLVFAVLMVWFLVGSFQSVQRFGLHIPHALIHAAMSLAMILMYAFPMPAASSGMSMSAAGPHLDPGLGALLALLFFGSAIFTLASPIKGASHHGSHLQAYAMSGATDGDARLGPHGGGPSPAGTVEALVALPWLEDLSHVVMCVGMGFMLILMI